MKKEVKRDRHLRWLVEQRNESRNIRNRASGDERVEAHAVYSSFRKLVKSWIRQQDAERTDRINSELKGV